MNPNVITIYKKLGETPLAALDGLRVEKPEYADATLSYIGRLDPMAEGDMLVLVGEENKNREAYLGLDKEYIFEVLFGIATDTQDILGLITDIGLGTVLEKEAIEKALASFVGKRTQEYPAYSSKPVDGKPLHMWAREGKLDEIEIPLKEVEIYSIRLEDFREMQKEELLQFARERVTLVKGDFRQAEIIARWEESLASSTEDSFQVANIKVYCSSGTYVRSIAAALGAQVGMPALALSIRRSRIDTR